MRWKGAIAVVAVFAFFFGASSTLEGQTHVGGHLSYGTEDFSDLGVGAHGTYLFTDVLAGAASFTYHFPGEDVNFWDMNFNAHYRFPIDAAVTPYLGGGINYSRISVDLPGFDSASDSEVGLNALGGAFFDLDNGARLFGEGRFVISDLDQLVLTFGASFPVGN